MTDPDRLGEVLRDAEGVRIEYLRTFPAAIDVVWAAVTEPGQMDRWLGRWVGDPETGEVEFVMSAEEDSDPQTVMIDECAEPTRLAVRIAGPDGPWPLEVALRESAEGTELRFVHHLDEPYDASAIGPGWQFYLDRLEAVLSGGPLPTEFDDYYPRLSAAYAIPPTLT
jgi:uncharacterized protein YndB with AHSA1/START domain